jgi:small subunit ribosomal protein S20
MGYKTRVRTAIKEVDAAISEKSQEQAQKKFSEAVSLLQKTASKGVIHKRNASRKISRLSKQLNQLTPS